MKKEELVKKLMNRFGRLFTIAMLIPVVTIIANVLFVVIMRKAFKIHDKIKALSPELF